MSAPKSNPMDPATKYVVRFVDLHRHIVQVEVTVPQPEGPEVELVLPTWTPGSYLVREFSRHVHEVSASGPDGALDVVKVSKNTWRVSVEGDPAEIRFVYHVYCYEMSVRTSFVDIDRAFLSPAALFVWVEGRAALPHLVHVEMPEQWSQLHTALPPADGGTDAFVAKNFDHLVDCPLMAGNHRVEEFDVRGRPHRLAVSGEGNRSVPSLVDDVAKVVDTVLELFGHVPYQAYTFLVHLSDRGYGGLEHQDSTALLFSRHALLPDDSYRKRWLPLVCHEFFHVFNVKRIRPKVFSNFDYREENYTRLLWVAEGATAYYDDYLVRRAGLTSARMFLDVVGESISRLMNAPGRKIQNLEQSSFDAWIKFYRTDEESPNVTISYYLKGGLVALITDMELRRLSGGERCLDDVMRLLYEDFRSDDYDGMRPAQYQEAVEAIAGQSMDEFFDRYVRGTDEIDFQGYFDAFGLRLVEGWKRSKTDGPPEGGRLGIEVEERGNCVYVSRVWRGSAAATDGLYVRDELVGIDGHRCKTESDFRARLRERPVGSPIRVTVTRDGQMRDVDVVLGEHPPDKFRVDVVEDLDAAQRKLLEGWLGEDLSSLGIE